jgi:hypothetical protein
VSRRTAIGGAAALTALVVSGCTNGSGPRSSPSAAPPGEQGDSPTQAPEDPDVALAAAVLRSEQDMLDRVLATARRHPRLAASVSGARAAHQAHVALLTRAVPGRSATPTPTPAPRVRPARVPASARSALASLAGAENRLSVTGRRRAGVARSGSFARVLASMAAASAQQAVHLSTLSPPAPDTP